MRWTGWKRRWSRIIQECCIRRKKAERYRNLKKTLKVKIRCQDKLWIASLVNWMFIATASDLQSKRRALYQAAVDHQLRPEYLNIFRLNQRSFLFQRVYITRSSAIPFLKVKIYFFSSHQMKSIFWIISEQYASDNSLYFGTAYWNRLCPNKT